MTNVIKKKKTEDKTRSRKMRTVLLWITDASLLGCNYLFAGLILYSWNPIYCIHRFRFILQWKKQSIPTESNPTDSTKMASADPDLQQGSSITSRITTASLRRSEFEIRDVLYQSGG